MQHYIQWGTSNSLVACMGTSYSPGPFLLSPFHLFFFPIPSNFFNSTGESMAMASTSFLLFYFLLSPFSHLTGFEGRVTTDHSSLLPLHKVEMASGGMTSGELIGSMAPICTYNECRGCRFKCSAEQIPVDASDPMNSAYRYQCVCHR
ncbi:EPIDERMAL PATTERNING FACTOR-like protein 9 [Zingiber officinale]|uniref:EPIDERMAL PATTERNING FACTOR-like protein 9 n=1 Tax=Zingiber officinale TaxID=94328 RepID=UPI001C4B1BF2|nr:EPIDERMAL PATTERNING FACTOR-like protein 9 [Zingiber officinale]